VTTLGHTDQLLRTTEIHDKFVDASTAFDNKTKQGFKYISKYIRDFLTNHPKVNAYQLRTLTNALLTYWNESINRDTENFWTELQANNIAIQRKNPLKFALTKKRFRNVEQGIDARNNWPDLKKLKSITDKFSKTDIEQIDAIIADDEQTRLGILKKCLRKKAIPPTQYLKVGECMAYFANCRLFDKYFTREQVEELYDIWKNFK
jgi:hypothetical protein